MGNGKYPSKTQIESTWNPFPRPIPRPISGGSVPRLRSQSETSRCDNPARVLSYFPNYNQTMQKHSQEFVRWSVCSWNCAVRSRKRVLLNRWICSPRLRTSHGKRSNSTASRYVYANNCPSKDFGRLDSLGMSLCPAVALRAVLSLARIKHSQEKKSLESSP